MEGRVDSTQVYFKKALARWGIPLVGCIPYNQYLYAPAMMDFEQLFKTSMISGAVHANEATL